MFGIGGIIKAIVALIIVAVVGVGLWYIINIKADLAISEMNNQKLQDGIKQQNDLIDQMKRDIEAVQQANAQLQEQNAKQKKDVESLSKKFDKDIGKRAADNPTLVEKLINRGTVNALRCVELASGSPLNDKEKSAKSPTEANRECPSLIDRDYVSPAN